GPVSQAPAPSGASRMTATDNLTAFVVNGKVIVQTALGQTTAQMPTADDITSDGTNVIASSDSDPDTAGIYRVTPLGQTQELFPVPRTGYGIWPFTLGPDRIIYEDNS